MIASVSVVIVVLMSASALITSFVLSCSRETTISENIKVRALETRVVAVVVSDMDSLEITKARKPLETANVKYTIRLFFPKYPLLSSSSQSTPLILSPPGTSPAVYPSIGRTRTPPLSSPHHDPLRIVLAAGGTGGHIYPAIAMADELRIASPSVQCVFLGTASGMESEAVPTAGHEFRPTVLSPENLLLFPFNLLHSIAAALKTLRDVDPRVVVGTGGYVSLPVCLAAAVLGVRVVIQEQNSTPGIANRVLSIFASKVFVAFPSCSRFFPKEKCFVTGNPVRASLLKYTSKAVARSHFLPGRKVGEGGKVVLVLGGSTGASAINIAMLNLYREMLEDHKEMFLIWQTGYDGFDEMQSLVKNHRRVVLTQGCGSNVGAGKTEDFGIISTGCRFLHTMDLAYAAADLVVSRAGATTCTEILVTGKPSILSDNSFSPIDGGTI
ncbi:hypothetical protein QJS10_CPA01g01579 [Acorus calamus]|uniref:Glycosyltransferase family 28 N-terminal domain-containing protein n=1 Tax=Acorus calamus TaxID=4465 RepID=A0AAV9FUC6_ACOCL|nr:hypothetical protein QJS10_CPA01g01579 [Acorus calamus]